MPDDTTSYDHLAARPPERVFGECDVQFVRRSGPGGQHRDKVSTGVVLVHSPTGVKAEAAERRSQAENRAVALFRLRVNLALEIRHEPDLDKNASPLWKSRCRGGRIELNPGHDDFPAMLAEALDRLAAEDFDPGRSAESLGCSASQLIKLLKKESRAFALANNERRRLGLHPLR